MTIFYKRFMKMIVILPFDGHDYTYLISRGLLAYFVVFCIFDCCMYTFYMINEVVPSIDTICETVVVVGSYARYFMLLTRRSEFADLLEESRAIWDLCDEEERRMVRLQFERKVRRLFKLIFGSCISINLLYSLSAIRLTLNAARYSNETDRRYFLPLKWFVEGAENSWPGYKFNFAVQLLLVVYGGAITSTVDSAVPLLIMTGAGYFRALQRHFFRAYDNVMYNNDQRQSADRQLVACSRLHQRILKYCSDIEKVSRSLFLMQLMCTGYNTSLIGIKLAGTDPDKYKYIPLGLVNLSQLFICEWASDHLINESSAISTTAYSVSFPWMKCRIGKLLVLIIVRSQRPVQMTAAGIVNLSLENFGAILKSALSFFTVLRNFNV